jgi:hypothetical protein
MRAHAKRVKNGGDTIGFDGVPGKALGGAQDLGTASSVSALLFGQNLGTHARLRQCSPGLVFLVVPKTWASPGSVKETYARPIRPGA